VKTYETKSRGVVRALLAVAVLSAGGVATAADFKAEHARWLKERETELTQPDGWTSLIGLHWVEGRQQTVGSTEGSGIRLRIGPPALGVVNERDGALFFSAAPGSGVTLDGKPLQGEAPLKAEGRGGGTKLAYDGGKGQITLIDRGGKHALRVRHADSPDRLHFKGLAAYAPDERWAVTARFVAHPPGQTINIVNILGDANESPNPGYIEFERDGRPWRLEATGDPAKGLSFVFKDATSGKETYGIGRFLKTGPVEADGTVVVDFNRAYNPPCAFTEYATCPLPPKENYFTAKNDRGETVRLAVVAGEKKYAGAH
jgi:uncharacterized protein (DUF1684 family)